MNEGQLVIIDAPSLGGYTFNEWQISPRDNTADKRDLTSSSRVMFSLNNDVDLYGVYTRNETFTTSPTLKLQTTKYDEKSALLRVKWQIPTGATINCAGMLISNNAGMKKMVYGKQFKYGQQNDYSLDLRNVLKSDQNSSAYDPNKQADLRERMLAGIPYDSRFTAVVYNHPANKVDSAGHYYVQQELFPESQAAGQGKWAYAMGYLFYTDQNGDYYRVLTNPVAVAIGDTEQFESLATVTKIG